MRLMSSLFLINSISTKNAVLKTYSLLFGRQTLLFSSSAADLIEETTAAIDDRCNKIGINSACRHIFLCADQSKPKCCQLVDGVKSWDYLKRRLRELKLSGAGGSVMRTKADCFQVCIAGPIAVIYPEAIWYHSCTPMVLEEIIQSHLIGGVIVEKYRFNRDNSIEHSPLNATTEPEW